MGRNLAPAVALALVAAAAGARADEGMWPPNALPAKTLKERYGFEPPAGWFERLQRSCVRFSTGGSGSIVSADGLVITNQHVGSDCLQDLSTAEEDLVKDGFLARTRAEELPCENLELLLLWSVEDVTERVNASVKPGASAADALAARRVATAAVEEEAKKATGLQCEVVSLYRGGQYHLYRYRRYTDVRLVFAPEQQAAFFGGDADNFEFPRFDLDICLFRIYEDGKPLRPEHWLRWSAKGSAEGDLVFVCGHPGSTQRLQTLEHLKFQRDVEIPTRLRRFWRREVQLQVFSRRGAEEARLAKDDLLSVENGRKAEMGTLAGLLDPAVMKGKAEEEARLRVFVAEDPTRAAKWGDAWEQASRALAAYRGIFARYSVLEGNCPLDGSDLGRYARTCVRLADQLAQASGDRLEEFRDSALPSLYLDLYSEAPIQDSLEVDRLASGLSLLAETLGGDDPAVVRALGGKSPRDRAEECVRGTGLRDVAVRRRLAEGGMPAVALSKDPLVLLAGAIEIEAYALRRRFEREIQGPITEAYAKIAAAQFARNDPGTYPDATFTLRLAFGAVKGYREDGRDIPAFTTLAGTFGRAEERKGSPDFELPRRWIDRKGALALETPFDFVCTADITGGNSGSPVVDRDGAFVGIVFDSNIHGLVWDIVYTDEQARTVAVDSRAILECLRRLYDAGSLADEIAGRPAEAGK